MADQLELGVARRVISPEVGGNLAGYGPNVISTSLHDDLTATAFYRDTIKILIIACSVALIIAIGVSLAIGIPIFTNASNNLNYSRSEAEEIATAYVVQRYPESSGKLEVFRVERELEVDGRIKNARYIYTFEIHNGNDRVIEIEVDSKTGKILEVD